MNRYSYPFFQFVLYTLCSIPVYAAPLKTPCMVVWKSDSFMMRGAFTWNYPEHTGGAVREYYVLNCFKELTDSFVCGGTQLRPDGIEMKNELGWQDITQMNHVSINIGGARSTIIRVNWGDYSFTVNDGGSAINGTVTHPREGTFTSSCSVEGKISYIK